jgi:hypothetical protein
VTHKLETPPVPSRAPHLCCFRDKLNYQLK